MTIRSFADLDALIQTRDALPLARERREARRSATSEGREAIEVEMENEEEEEEQTGQEREKGAGMREGEKKSRTLNCPLALGP